MLADFNGSKDDNMKLENEKGKRRVNHTNMKKRP